MEKLLRAKKWLTLEDAARRLSISLDEEITRRDVLQLCADNELLVSIYISHGVAYSKLRRFCVTHIDMDALNHYAYEYIHAKRQLLEQLKGSEVNLMEAYEALPEYERYQVWLYAADVMYEWFDPDTLEASYKDEYKLSGVYYIHPFQPRFFNWLTERVIGNIGSEHDKNFNSSLLHIHIDEEVEPVTIQLWAGSYEDQCLVRRTVSGFEHDCRNSENPYLKDLESMLVIQTHDLLDFEKSLLKLENETGRESTQARREETLRKLLDELGIDSVRELGRSGTWDALSEIDQHLFGHRGAETINKFFNKQKLISYR